MRQVSQSAMSAMLSESSTLVPITLLEISHPNQSTLYFCNNNEDVVHNGQTYQWYPFELTLPSSTDSDEKITTQITIANIDQSIISLLRSLQTAPTITLSLIYVDAADDPPTSDSAEYGPIELKYKRQDVTPKTITGTVSLAEDFLNQAFLPRTFNPYTARGIFQ